DDAGYLHMREQIGLPAFFAHRNRMIAPGDGLTGQAAASGRILVAESLDDLGLDARRRERMRRVGIQTFVGVPLTAREQVVGAMSLATLKPRRYSAHDLRVLNAMGHQIGIALENHLLQQRHLQMEQERARMLQERMLLVSR